jgi:hypothetical protein
MWPSLRGSRSFAGRPGPAGLGMPALSARVTSQGVRKDPPSSTLDSDTRPPVLTESGLRRRHLLHYPRTVPLVRPEELSLLLPLKPDAPTAPATGGP